MDTTNYKVPNYTIVPLSPKDEDQVLALYASAPDVWESGIGVAWYRFWQEENVSARWDGIWIDGKLVAAVHWSLKQNPIGMRNIADIATLPEYRRRGLAQALVEWVGFPCTLKVVRSLSSVQDIPSHKFYKAMGFKVVDEKNVLTKSGDVRRSTYYQHYGVAPMTEIVRPGDFPIVTFTGKLINLNTMEPKDVDIEDINHALSNINRFNGHTVKPLSVAQHAVCVSYLAGSDNDDIDLAWHGLCHDNAEAYLGDINKWMKRTDAFSGYRQMEERIERICAQAMGHPPIMGMAVTYADTMMLQYEIEYTYGTKWVNLQDGDNGYTYQSLSKEDRERVESLIPSRLQSPLSWREAKKAFRARFRELGGPERIRKARIG